MSSAADPNAADARREEALELLPATYAVAMRLRDAGAPSEEIAQRAGVEPEAVGPLLEIAEGKLAALQRGDGPC